MENKKDLTAIKNLYADKLKYNCGWWLMTSKNHADLLLVSLGCFDFVITTVYNGVVAIGRRVFDYDTKTAKYTYAMTSRDIKASRVEALIKTYEAKRLKIYSVEVERVEDVEG